MVIKINYTSSDVYVSTSVSPVYVVVNYSGTSGGGGAVWGGITGTLSDQTDLQTALDAKVPYTGATGNVNLGEFALSAGQVTLDTTPTGTASVGTTRWNDTIGSSETTLKGGNVILKNGVDLVARVVNKVTPNATLTKSAYQAVKISGAQGQRLAVALAQANNDANSADTIGLVTETIATNQEGFIMTVGNLEGINTTGSLQGETWADGDVLYLSPTTAGALTNIKPTGATGHIVVVGYVEYAHANNGKIYCKIMNGWELDELHNVYITSPANSEALIYESATSLWKNKTIATALGYTPVPTTRTLTINGTAYDLSADRSWTVSGTNIYTADGTLTGNRTVTMGSYGLTFVKGDNLTGQFVSYLANNLSAGVGIGWNGIYAIGSNTNVDLELISKGTGSVLSSSKINFSNANLIFKDLNVQNNSINSNVTDFYINYFSAINAGSASFRNTIISNGKNGDIAKFVGSTGNLILQTGGTFTDAGYKLDVNGTARVSGRMTTSIIDTVGSSLYIYDGGATNNRYGLGLSSATLNVFGGNNVLLGVQRDQSTMTQSNANIWLSNGLTQVNTVFDASSYKYIYAPISISSAITASFGSGRFHNTYNASGTTYTQYPILSITRAGEAGVGYDMSASFGIRRRIIGGSNPKTTLDINVGETAINGYPDVTIMTISAEGVGVNNTTPSTSAMLDVASTTKGFLAPRMTTTEKNAIASPATGLQVYDTTLNAVSVYDGVAWVSLGAGGGGSMAIGGAITSATAGSVLFAGTSGVLQQDNTNFFWDDANNRLGIGINNPTSTFHILGTQTLQTLTQTIIFNNKYISGSDGRNIFFGGGGASITGNAGALSSYNNSFGYQALLGLTTGYFNNAFGFESLYTLTTGTNNSAFGMRALKLNSTGSDNTAFGANALQNNTSGANTAIGSQALINNIGGNYNTAVGLESLKNNSSGIYSTAIGAQALLNNTTGSNNTAIGLQAGLGGTANTTGSNNIFIGYSSGGVSATESNRTWIGNGSTLSTWLGGNLLLGSTTNGSERLQVTGDSKFSGRVKFTPQTTPGTPAAGDVYYDSTTNKLRCYNGTIWNDLF